MEPDDVGGGGAAPAVVAPPSSYGKGGLPEYGKDASPPNTNIYVAGLPQDIDDAKLKEVFGQYGEVVWHKVLGMRQGRIAGIVEFGSLDHATWVVENVHGSIPQGLAEAVDIKFKDEGRNKGKGKGDRFSPYGWDDDWGKGDKGMGKGKMGDMGGMGGKGQVVPPPQVELQPVDNIYIKGLPTGCDEALLRQMFGNFGTITQCKLCPGEQRISALVRFSSVSEATTAIATMNGVAAGGSDTDEGGPVKLEVRYADTWESRQKRNSDGTSFSIETIVKGFEQSGLMPGGTGRDRYDNNNQCALYIAGLPSDTTDFHLFRMFSPLGAIAPRGVRALMNEDGTCKGIAFVNYLNSESTHMAIAVYNGAVMPEGGRLKVAVKSPKPQGMPTVVPAPGPWDEGGAMPKVVPPPQG